MQKSNSDTVQNGIDIVADRSRLLGFVVVFFFTIFIIILFSVIFIFFFSQ